MRMASSPFRLVAKEERETMADETCRAFDTQAPPDPGAVHRSVVGADPFCDG